MYIYIYIYVFGCKLSLVRLCDSDFGITPVNDITVGFTCAAVCFHIAHISFASSWYLFCLSDIILARLCVLGGSYVYQKCVLCFLIHESYVRSIKIYCFVCRYAAIPVQLEIFILLCTGWCIMIIWNFIIRFKNFCLTHCTEQSKHGTENMTTFKDFGMTITCKYYISVFQLIALN